MKQKTAIFLLILIYLGCSSHIDKPRVFVFTDINIDKGDPDDRQSLLHLLWYANELSIAVIIPDRWDAEGYEACMLALNAYGKDYPRYGFATKGYPSAKGLENTIARDLEEAKRLFIEAATNSDAPLYVLVWGNMKNFGRILRERPELLKKIRLITI